MLLILEIKQNKIRLNLASGKKKSDKAEWKENNSLSRLLLSKIDEMLRGNKMGLDKISGYKIISNVPKNWTSARIAKITFESLTIGKLAK